MVRFENAGKFFGGSVALKGISLEIGSCERVALIGPSGAGKSTLLNLVNGSVVPDEGKVHVLGQQLASLRGNAKRLLQARIGTVYQQHHLIGPLSVLHNINSGRLARWSLAQAVWSLVMPQQREQAAQILARVGLADRVDQRVDTLSGGQQQRVALARVLAQNPEIVVADEPVASVDPERGREMLGLLRDVCTATRKTLLVSLHTLDTLGTHFTRVVGLRGGQVMFDLPANAVGHAQLGELYRLA